MCEISTFVFRKEIYDLTNTNRKPIKCSVPATFLLSQSKSLKLLKMCSNPTFITWFTRVMVESLIWYNFKFYQQKLLLDFQIVSDWTFYVSIIMHFVQICLISFFVTERIVNIPRWDFMA